MTTATRYSAVAKASITLLTTLALAGGARAEGTPSEHSAAASGMAGRLLLEIDPATYVFSGYSAHVRLALPQSPAWTVGFGIYGMKLPSLMVDMESENKAEGWDVLLKNGYGLFTDYHFGGEPRGLFVGLQAGLQRYEITRDIVIDKRSQYWTILVMPRIGYLWQPISDIGFFVIPWLGVGPNFRISGSATLMEEEYKLPPVVAFATLHTGWRF